MPYLLLHHDIADAPPKEILGDRSHLDGLIIRSFQNDRHPFDIKVRGKEKATIHPPNLLIMIQLGDTCITIT